LNKITELKSAPKGESRRKKICEEGISTNFFAGGTAKHAHLAGGNDLLTQNKNKTHHVYNK
jgi:hypothetical protein